MATSKKDDRLDIFEVLKQADLSNVNWYSQLSTEDKAKFQPLVVMKWFSGLNDNTSDKNYYIQIVNQLVNVNFWDLTKHPELQWKLMAACGLGKVQRHQWVNLPKRQSMTKLGTMISEYYPDANNQEIDLILSKFTTESFNEFIRNYGIQESEERELKSEFDKWRKKRNVPV